MGRSSRRYPPSLSRRRTAQVQPKLKLLIFCEGKNTEPAYFEGVAEAFGNRLVRVDAQRAAGTPRTLVDKALSHKKKIGRPQNSFEENDQIWVVFDRDEHPHVMEAINLAKEHRVGVAFSNPCFEIWGLMHFDNCDAPIHRHDAQKSLASKLKGYEPNKSKSLDLAVLLPKTGEASARAANTRKRRESEGDPLGCPYTDVDLLTNLIIENGKAC